MVFIQSILTDKQKVGCNLKQGDGKEKATGAKNLLVTALQKKNALKQFWKIFLMLMASPLEIAKMMVAALEIAKMMVAVNAMQRLE